MATPDPLASLLSGIAAGDQDAMSELYDATSRRVFGLALGILREHGAAEEAALDVYNDIWQRADSYDPGRGGVIAWILLLARSRAIDHLRSRARHWDREAILETANNFHAPHADPEVTSRQSQAAGRVRAALAALPASQRDALAAVYFCGLSHTEVADVLHQPLGTVKTRIRRGLIALRETLNPIEGELR